MRCDKTSAAMVLPESRIDAFPGFSGFSGFSWSLEPFKVCKNMRSETAAFP